MTTARDLTLRLADLLRDERAALAEFLVLLSDFDRRRLWLDLGHASLFAFLHRELGLSKGAAHYRKTAAELVERFPEIVEPLRDGRLCLSSVVELAKVISPENRDEVLPRFFHRSKREAAEVAAELRPDDAPRRRDVVTVPRMTAPLDAVQSQVATVALPPPTESIPTSAAPAVEATARVHLAERVDANSPAGTHPAGRGDAGTPDGRARVHLAKRPDANLLARGRGSSSHAERGPPAVEPLTADLRRLHVTVSRRFIEKLEAARLALSHASPGASAEEILETGLDLLLAQPAKRRGQVERPRANDRPAKPDHVPAHVKREVWKRDEGKCQWELDSGGVCGSRLRLEFDHRVPRARGGPSTVDNVRLLCASHNQLAARLAFGDEWVDRFARGAARSPGPPSAPGP